MFRYGLIIEFGFSHLSKEVYGVAKELGVNQLNNLWTVIQPFKQLVDYLACNDFRYPHYLLCFCIRYINSS